MPTVLVIAFIVVPIVEIWFLIQVGQVIGPWWTIALLLVDSFVGAWLVRHEGRRAWAALRERIQGGRFPSRELADAALILVGGTLLLTPGFLTDILGFALVLPLTRPLARRMLAWLLYRRVSVAARHATAPSSRVVAGEVVDGGNGRGRTPTPGGTDGPGATKAPGVAGVDGAPDVPGAAAGPDATAGSGSAT